MPEPTTRQPILAARGLVKRFGRVIALSGSDFELYPGEVLAVIGDNGAGKSSLIKCLSGAMVPDEGEIELNGEPVQFKRPQDARAAGIETVYQTLAVAPALDIATNMFLGRERRRPGPLGSILRMMDTPGMRRDAKQALDDLGIGTLQDITQTVETLSGGQRQAVAVARAAAFGSKVVILDEPTAALGVRESGQVLQLIRDLRQRGLARHPDQPQHAARVRGRRPHPHPATRSPRRRGHAAVAHDGAGRRDHDRRGGRLNRTGLRLPRKRPKGPSEEGPTGLSSSIGIDSI